MINFVHIYEQTYKLFDKEKNLPKLICFPEGHNKLKFSRVIRNTCILI
jgi:hypothetical protein